MFQEQQKGFGGHEVGSGEKEAQTWALRKRAGYRGVKGASVSVSSVRLTPAWFWAFLAPEPLGGVPTVLIALREREPGRQPVTGALRLGSEKPLAISAHLVVGLELELQQLDTPPPSYPGIPPKL